MLNQYFEPIVKVCDNNGGTINEIIGDGLLIFFGAPVARDDHAEAAISCALEMQLAMDNINNENIKNGLPQLEMGIGINTGTVVAGNIGSSHRKEYAVIGDTVNMASRLCNIARKNMIIISEATFQKVKDHVAVNKVEGQKIKGKKEPVTFYVISKIVK